MVEGILCVSGTTYIGILLIIAIFIVFILTIRKGIVVVPPKEEWLVERLGKYRTTLKGGLHFVVPGLDELKGNRRVDMRETTEDVDSQQCITKDGILLHVDGIIYLQVTDAYKACYQIDNYRKASIQLAMTSLRTVIGEMELDKAFSNRQTINEKVCMEVDNATQAWGVKIKRYEIQDIKIDAEILEAMELQMKAEREKRAKIAESEGNRQKMINESEGKKAAAIANSEAEKQSRVNDAEGRAMEIKLVSEATANGLREIANAIATTEGGRDAMNLRLAEQYIVEFGKLAKTNNTMIMPTDLANVSGFIKTATTVMESVKTNKN